MNHGKSTDLDWTAPGPAARGGRATDVLRRRRGVLALRHPPAFPRWARCLDVRRWPGARGAGCDRGPDHARRRRSGDRGGFEAPPRARRRALRGGLCGDGLRLARELDTDCRRLGRGQRPVPREPLRCRCRAARRRSPDDPGRALREPDPRNERRRVLRPARRGLRGPWLVRVWTARRRRDHGARRRRHDRPLSPRSRAASAAAPIAKAGARCSFWPL